MFSFWCEMCIYTDPEVNGLGFDVMTNDKTSLASNDVESVSEHRRAALPIIPQQSFLCVASCVVSLDRQSLTYDQNGAQNFCC